MDIYYFCHQLKIIEWFSFWKIKNVSDCFILVKKTTSKHRYRNGSTHPHHVVCTLLSGEVDYSEHPSGPIASYCSWSS